LVKREDHLPIGDDSTGVARPTPAAMRSLRRIGEQQVASAGLDRSTLNLKQIRAVDAPGVTHIK
jgi:hypothetical protein